MIMAGRKKMKRSKSNGNAPEGFAKIESPHMSGFWVPTLAGQAVQGVVGESITSAGRDGKPNQYYLLMLTNNDSGPVVAKEDGRKKTIEVGEGMMIGVGGAVLLSLLRGREGKEIYAVFTGLGPKKPGKSQARMFEVYERER